MPGRQEIPLSSIVARVEMDHLSARHLNYSGLPRVPQVSEALRLGVCVECLFLRHRGPVPYGTNQRAPKWRPTRTPPVIPLPESLAAQGPYIRLSCPGLARARNVSRHWGPPRACHRAPCCEKGGPQWPQGPSPQGRGRLTMRHRAAKL